MGRFPWSQGHSRQGSDRSIGRPQDWFSKNTNEPSRQALNDMMKEHNHNGAEGSQSSKTRSRANTVSSKMSKESKSPTSDRAEQVLPRPDSRQSTFLDHLSFGTGAPDKQSRGLFSKGSRMIRRKTSKLSLQPSAFDDAVFFLGGAAGTGGKSPPAKTDYRGSQSPRGTFDHVVSCITSDHSQGTMFDQSFLFLLISSMLLIRIKPSIRVSTEPS